MPQISRSKLGLDPAIALSLTAALVFFVMSGAVAYLNLRMLREDSGNIDQSHQVITTLDGLLSSAQDAETGQRGFLLTNDERYLAPYNSAVGELPAKLAQLARDNPSQAPRLSSLRAHVSAKLAELKNAIDLRRTEGLEAALAVVNSDRGKAEMDAIRAEIAAMAQEEAALRSTRLAEMGAAQNIALASGLLSVSWASF
jgi:CHASE3 domain sensor protein